MPHLGTWNHLAEFTSAVFKDLNTLCYTTRNTTAREISYHGGTGMHKNKINKKNKFLEALEVTEKWYST